MGHALGIPDNSAHETSDDQSVESWPGTFPETLRMGGGPSSSEVGTSGLDHSDYILANKLNVPRAVL